MIACDDCRTWLPTLAPASCDSCVTDPPYGLEFMGQDWDRGVPGPPFWREVRRVLKPGAFLVAFGGTRMYHRLVTSIEDGGFEIKDALAWLHGEGFPKSLDVAREIEAHDAFDDGTKRVYWDTGEPVRTRPPFRNESANRAVGLGTGLKPALELLCLARKPLGEGNVATNLLRHGTGALNIDGCRVAGPDGSGQWGSSNEVCPSGPGFNKSAERRTFRSERHPQGRWPANVCLDEAAAAQLDAQVGPQRSGGTPPRRPPDRERAVYGAFAGEEDPVGIGRSAGPVSRFYFCAKATRAEREAGLEDYPLRALRWSSGQKNPGSFQSEGTEREVRNYHPTVKPIELMRWLVRLVTPADGIVIDPFAGTGSTLIGAGLEGFRYAGCEQDPGYRLIAAARLAHWLGTHPPEVKIADLRELGGPRQYGLGIEGDE